MADSETKAKKKTPPKKPSRSAANGRGEPPYKPNNDHLAAMARAFENAQEWANRVARGERPARGELKLPREEARGGLFWSLPPVLGRPFWEASRKMDAKTMNLLLECAASWFLQGRSEERRFIELQAKEAEKKLEEETSRRRRR